MGEQTVTSYAKLRELAENATDGEWQVSSSGAEDGYRAVIAVWEDDDMHITDDGVPDYDAEFIAAANPRTVIGLLDEIERLRSGRGSAPETGGQS